MIKFKQKQYTEYDAMRSLYKEMVNNAHGDRRRMPNVCNPSSLPSILKGSNIIIERFVITPSILGKDKYRMYLKIGAKAKLPDNVRLPSESRTSRLGSASINFNATQRAFSNKSNKGGGGGEQVDYGDRMKFGKVSTSFNPDISIIREEKKLLGEVVKYDKPSRSLILEFTSIRDAIKALDILPFGLEYRYYLLES